MKYFYVTALILVTLLLAIYQEAYIEQLRRVDQVYTQGVNARHEECRAMRLVVKYAQRLNDVEDLLADTMRILHAVNELPDERPRHSERRR